MALGAFKITIWNARDCVKGKCPAVIITITKMVQLQGIEIARAISFTSNIKVGTQ
jgi:hypothetical protein